MEAAFCSEVVDEDLVVAGYLDLEGCAVLELLPSDWTVTCISCTTEDSLPALAWAYQTEHNCFRCHLRSSVDLREPRFRELGPPMKAKATTPKPLIEGQPLPETGTCKHYRCSHRWLRFPCCQRAYEQLPLDIQIRKFWVFVSKFSKTIRSFRTRLDLFGPIRTCLDAFVYVRMQPSEAFG